MVLAVVIGFAIRGGDGRSPAADGALRVANHGNFAIAVKVGQVSTYGDLLVRNIGPGPVTLESISWDQRAAEGIEIVGRLVAGPMRKETVGFDFEFPLREVAGATAPLEGYHVPPTPSEGATQILIGVKVTRPGRHELRRIRVHYRSGGERRTLEAPGLLKLCAPAPTPCSAPW